MYSFLLNIQFPHLFIFHRISSFLCSISFLCMLCLLTTSTSYHLLFLGSRCPSIKSIIHTCSTYSYEVLILLHVLILIYSCHSFSMRFVILSPCYCCYLCDYNSLYNSLWFSFYPSISPICWFLLSFVFFLSPVIIVVPIHLMHSLFALD